MSTTPTNAQSSSWLLEGAPATLLSKLDTTIPEADAEKAASNKAAMMKLAGVWVDLTDGLAHDHADVVKELGCKWFGDEAFGAALQEVIAGGDA